MISKSIGAAVMAVGIASTAPAQAAGLLDFLFGSPPPPPPQPVVSSDEGLRMTVRPRNRTLKRAAAQHDGKKQVNTAIDPVSHPNWFLEDPTLRKGDVVVLNGQVLVFNGGRPPFTRADFSPLSQSRLLSQATRDRIRAMAGLMPETLPGKTAAAPRTQTALQQETSAGSGSN